MSSFPVLAGNDDIITLKGEIECTVSDYLTPAEAKLKAIEYARIKLLKDAFGVQHGSSNIMVDRQEGGHTETSILTVSQTDTNGEWIRDLKEPEIVSEKSTKYGMLYSVKVKGEARRIEHQKIDLDVRLLCNGCDRDRNLLRGFEYYDGDNFYVYFNSPVSGWLTIYLQDDDSKNTMQAILPYEGQQEGAYRIEADKEYVFFSRQHAEPQYVDIAGGLKMYARKKLDLNVVYIVFSPNEFSKANTKENKTSEKNIRIEGQNVNLMPRETDFKKFNEWMGKVRKKDSQMQVYKFPIKIIKPK
ncbi:MAG: hypothetical protein K2M94_02600 [Paramuribaculum sp.]|nr:hypothetical protein [Paramuribaculum sp.]